MARHVVTLEESSDGGLELVCVLCNSGERKLRFLHCLHSACDDCLVNAGTSILCPVCDTRTDKKMNQLPGNFLQEMTRLKSHFAQPQVCFMCTVYGKSNIGTSVCMSCEQGHLCDHCLTLHKQQPATKTHEPLYLSDLLGEANKTSALTQSIPQCPVHHQPLRYYCETCERSACQDCLILDHRDGNHKIETVDKVAARKYAVLEKQIAALKPVKDQTLTDIQNLEATESVQKQEREQLCNEVNARVSALKDLIDTIGEETLTNIARVYDEQEKITRDKISELRKKDKQIDNAVSVTRKSKQFCSHTHLVGHQQLLSECLTLAGQGTKGEITRNTIILQKPKQDATPDVFKEMLGELTIQTDRSPVANIYWPPNVLRMRPPMANIIGKLEVGKHVQVEMVHRVNVKEMGLIYGMDISSDGDILVAGEMEGGHEPSIAVFTIDGQVKPRIKHAIASACQIALDGDDIYVGNKDDKCVTVLNKQGVVQNTIKIGHATNSDLGVTVEGQRVYIAVKSTHKLYSCLKGADCATEWAPAVTNLRHPHYLCGRGNGDIAVSNCWDHTISSINDKEQIAFCYGSKGCGDGQLNMPYGLCSDSDGRIYIADYINDRISIVSQYGQLITNIVTQQHNIHSPRDVKIWNDLLVVAHSDTKVAIFKLHI